MRLVFEIWNGRSPLYCRKVARVITKDDGKQFVEGDIAKLQKYLGVARFRYGKGEENDEIGLATGMAWTQVGGELLAIETIILPGKGKLTVTGKLGEVMQESAQAAMSYVRSRAGEWGWIKTSIENSIYTSMSRRERPPKTGLQQASPWPRRSFLP